MGDKMKAAQIGRAGGERGAAGLKPPPHKAQALNADHFVTASGKSWFIPESARGF